jgi:hypothetical protein
LRTYFQPSQFSRHPFAGCHHDALAAETVRMLLQVAVQDIGQLPYLPGNVRLLAMGVQPSLTNR